MNRVFVAAAVGVMLLAAGPNHAAAQDAPGKFVISANPFGLLLDFFNAEFERSVGTATSAGIGGSTFSNDNVRYINADVFVRYYPNDAVFEGWNFGMKVGLTSLNPKDENDTGGTKFGYGFDVNYSWLLGSTNRMSVSTGFGLKRLVGASDDFMQYVPTFRVVNVGFRF
jgi:hypothetical protein